MTYQPGQTVIITKACHRFGATGTIQSVTVSPHSGLDLITIDGTAYYEDEVMSDPSQHIEWDTPAGRDMEPIEDLAHLHGWAVHRTHVDAGGWRVPALDMISPPDQTGTSAVLHATQPIEGRWIWSVWTHDSQARVIDGPHHGQGAYQDISFIIRAASDTGIEP